MNILITGSSGYIGRFILKHINRNKYTKIICLINSEKRFKENEYLFKDCLIYKGDIGNKKFIQEIFNENKIDFVIHTAAMKYIDTCELFQQQCIDTNITGTLNICKYAKKNNVTNVLTISTDKANNPGCLYGISKLAAERITISHGYSVYQGVNFWNSDGSFTQKWKSTLNNNERITLYNDKHIRYFSDPHETAKEMLELVETNNNKINYPKECWKIKIVDVFNILKEKYSNSLFEIRSSKENDFDKVEEEIHESTNVTILQDEQLKKLVFQVFIF